MGLIGMRCVPVNLISGRLAVSQKYRLQPGLKDIYEVVFIRF